MKTKQLRIYILCMAISAFHGCSVSAQDIHFSQFFEAPLLRNPALAGIFTGDMRVQAVYRDQWNSVTSAYKTTSLNAEYKMPLGKGNDFITAGLQLLQDKAGSISWVSNHVMPAMNFHKSLDADRNSFLSLGFMGGVVQRTIDRSKLTTNSTYDGLGDGENFLSNSITNFDGIVGLSFNTNLREKMEDNMFIGLAYHHFNRPRNSFYKNNTSELAPKFVGSVGVRFSVTPQGYFTLQGDYTTQGAFRELIGGALYGIKLGDDWENPTYILHGGAFLRWDDAIIPVLKLDYLPFAVSFSYDVNISKLKSSSYGRGGFELGVSYQGFTNRKNSALNAILCPRF